MTLPDYLMAICATWYVTFILVKLPGPRGIFAIMRSWRLLHVMDCMYCLSLYVGLIFYSFAILGYTDIVNVFGIIGAAHMLAAWTGANYGEGGN